MHRGGGHKVMGDREWIRAKHYYIGEGSSGSGDSQGDHHSKRVSIHDRPGGDHGYGGAGVDGGDIGDTVPGVGQGYRMGMGEGKGIENNAFGVPPSHVSCADSEKQKPQ